MICTGDVIVQFRKSDPISDTKERNWTNDIDDVLFVTGHKTTVDGEVCTTVNIIGYEYEIPVKSISDQEDSEYMLADDALHRILEGIEERR